MKGIWKPGRGLAHNYLWKHDPVFNCRMVGTANLHLDGPITEFRPARRQWRLPTDDCPEGWYWYWLVRLEGTLYAWAYKWQGSALREGVVEVLTKAPLPADLRNCELDVAVLEPWSHEQRDEWARGQHTHQTFPWWPSERVDSERKWLVIDRSLGIPWSNLRVLDIGSHYGYFSFRASAAGARVTAVEPGYMERNNATIINERIEMQDVEFLARDPFETWDVIFYLSVHHLCDPPYDYLASQVEALAGRIRRAVFVEVILPPLFGGRHSVADVDEMVGGQVLDTYEHVIRGHRRIYKVEGKA